MEYLLEWSDFDPKLDKKVKDFVEDNWNNLSNLLDMEISEEENIKFMIKYFKKYPNEMKSTISKLNKEVDLNKPNPLKTHAPLVQNIGGVDNYNSF